MARVAKNGKRGCVALLALLLVGAAVGLGVSRGVRRNASACATCHAATTAVHTWQSGNHGRVPCGRCHAQGVTHVVVKRLSGARPTDQTRAATPKPQSDRACRTCHLTLWRGRGSIRQSDGHRKHLLGAKLSCLQCHNGSLHAYQPKPESCTTCHQKTVDTIQKAGRDHCVACHSFADMGGTLNRQPTVCDDCHRERKVDASAGVHNSSMQFACSVCHRPHTAEKTQASCVRCHTRAVTPTTPAAHRDCAACHNAHDWKFAGVDRCRSCHVTLPANVAAHSVPGHPERFCTECHQPHAWKFAGRATCTNCHKQQQALPHPVPWVQGHQPDARAKRDTCATCHEQAFCAACHSHTTPQSHAAPTWKTKQHGQTALGNRAACATCHTESFCNACHGGVAMPHAKGWRFTHGPAGKQASVCAKCHATSFCNTCHGGPNRMPPDHATPWLKKHGALAASNPKRCQTCHVASRCTACHGTQMPHPSDWLPGGHAKQGTFRRDGLCLKCHEQKFCYRTCHTPPSKS